MVSPSSAVDEGQVKKLSAKDYLRNAIGVMRPGLSMVYSMVYLYATPRPTFPWFLYFATMYPLATSAGNDYMDWEHDHADPNRVADVSRGKASTKDECWYLYALGTSVAAIIGLFDPGFAVMYLVGMEIPGQWFYNGIFFGIPMNRPSICKGFGFPIDVLINCLFATFSGMVGTRSWTPPMGCLAIAFATTMWAQLKDYDHEKNTDVNTVATFLGPTATKLLAISAIPVMLSSSWGFLPYCLFLPLKLTIPHRVKKIKLSLAMAGQLFLLTVVKLVRLNFFTEPEDFPPISQSNPLLGSSPLEILHAAAPNTDMRALVRYTTLLGVGFAARFSISCARFVFGPSGKRFYYAWLGVYNRKQPYDPAVWDEPIDSYTLLLKVSPKIGRSATALIMLFPEKQAPGTLFAYLAFRIQDTWADVCENVDDRIAGLKILPARLRQLQKGQKPEADTLADKVKWDLSAPKHKLYVDIVRNVHRFDSLFTSLSAEEQETWAKYAEAIGEGMAELERSKNEPASLARIRRTCEVGNDIGGIALMKMCGLTDLASELEVRPATELGLSFQDYSDYTYFGNLITTLEEDFGEGICHDIELQKLNGVPDQNVFARVKSKWIRIGLEKAKNSSKFMLHPDLEKSTAARILFLGFNGFSVETYKQLVAAELGEDPPRKKSVWEVLLGVALSSLSWNGYKRAFEAQYQAEGALLEALNKRKQD